MCLPLSTENQYQENEMIRICPQWPRKYFLSLYQDFLVRTMNSSIIQIFLSVLEAFDEKQPGLIISCKLYPFYSWKVYMENKNKHLKFSSHWFTSRFGCKEEKKRLPEPWNICKKKAYLVGAPAKTTSILTLCPQYYWTEHLWHADQCSDH